ncbi:MAG: squalene/phytoene synthase family protein [Verrucomicrobiales bacterium]|nr:squalene/phytoene synthase family protein [Verrucomicrobiales bacterium]
MTDESSYERELGGQLLASVSRSFYLTLRALPKEVREPISLAYLLARTADTLADTAAVSAQLRLALLADYAGLLAQRDEAREVAWSMALERDFAPLQTDAAEARLMQRARQGLAWFWSLDEATRTLVTAVLREIISGQVLDIERFPGDGPVASLRDAAELEDYTWRVAGCVGAFWTDLCALRLPDAFVEGAVLEDLRSDGTRLGKGLQLVNILRDVAKDRALGRCYLPAEQWEKSDGESAETFLRDPGRVTPLWDHWAQVCETHLEAGARYVVQVRDGKLRYATALPLMLAWRTLARMRQTAVPGRWLGVKVSRLEVARVLAEAVTACRSEEALERWIDRVR